MAITREKSCANLRNTTTLGFLIGVTRRFLRVHDDGFVKWGEGVVR